MTETEPTRRKGPSTRVLALCLVATGLLSFYLNTFHNGFPMRYHPDERKKVRSVLEGRQDFKHPILMLQVSRVLNRVNVFDKKKDVLLVGRTVNAFFGAVIAVATYFVAVRIMRRKYALFSSLAVAVSPILVIHSHYFKEDIILTAMIVLSLIMFLYYVEKPGRLAALGVGVLTGMAVSSHYKGILLFLLFAVVPLLTGRARTRAYALDMAIVFLVSVIAFAVINYPLFTNFDKFEDGLKWSTTQATRGHQLKIYPTVFFFCFHIIHSIMPGMTLLPALCSIAAVGWACAGYRSLDSSGRILLAALLILYFAVEISPMKEFPGYMRYALPTVPLLLVFCWKAVERLMDALSRREYRSMIAAIGVLIIVLPAISSAGLVWHLYNETRDRAMEWILVRGRPALFESYSCQYRGIERLSNASVEVYREQGFKYLVASSFMYDRFELGGRLEHQHPDIYRCRDRYEELFKYPYTEIRPAYKSFALSNPVIRIIDIGEQ